MASLSLPLISWRPTVSSKHLINQTHKFSAKMALNFNTTTTALASNDNSSKRKLPILLFDVMDTIVRDPFYEDVPAFFRMSMKELLECKHPTVWIEFEKGLIDEILDYQVELHTAARKHVLASLDCNSELARRFFKDERSFDLEGLKNCMKRGYSYIEGVEDLLHALKKNGYEIHAFTNYPIWYKIIEDKLKLSTYLSWTFCSCIFGKRKPEADFYLEVLKHLKVEPGNCIFIDDRMRNVEAAIEAGFRGLQFKGADMLRKDLPFLGVELSTNEENEHEDLGERVE